KARPFTSASMACRTRRRACCRARWSIASSKTTAAGPSAASSSSGSPANSSKRSSASIDRILQPIAACEGLHRLGQLFQRPVAADERVELQSSGQQQVARLSDIARRKVETTEHAQLVVVQPITAYRKDC